MILAAHQPYYLPWLPYFHKLSRCDVFVVLDHVQYGSESYQNRNRIKLASGPHWITVPVARRGLGETIAEKRIAETTGAHDWQRRTWRTIEQSYQKATYLSRYREALFEIYAQPWQRLSEINLRLLELAMEWLGISTPVVRSTTLAPRSQKSELIAELCTRLGCDTYLSGAGGSRGYLDESFLVSRGIRVLWQHPAHPVYPQQYAHLGFISGLSVLDALLNCGPDSRQLVEQSGVHA